MVGACSPSYLEAEAGESLEPGRQRLQWAKIATLHSSLGNRVTPSKKKKKKRLVFKHYNHSCLTWLDTKPHPHLSDHQTIQHSFLNCELFEATSLSTTDYCFQALTSSRESQQGWEEPAQPWRSTKMWPIQALHKSQQCSPVPGPFLQSYRQIGLWFWNGKFITPNSRLNVYL